MKESSLDTTFGCSTACFCHRSRRVVIALDDPLRPNGNRTRVNLSEIRELSPGNRSNRWRAHMSVIRPYYNSPTLYFEHMSPSILLLTR